MAKDPLSLPIGKQKRNAAVKPVTKPSTTPKPTAKPRTEDEKKRSWISRQRTVGHKRKLVETGQRHAETRVTSTHKEGEKRQTVFLTSSERGKRRKQLKKYSLQLNADREQRQINLTNFRVGTRDAQRQRIRAERYDDRMQIAAERAANQQQLAQERQRAAQQQFAVESVNTTGNSVFRSATPTAATGAVQSSGQSASAMIVRAMAAFLGLSLLYLFVSNQGQAGVGLVNGAHSVLLNVTSGTPLFAPKAG